MWQAKVNFAINEMTSLFFLVNLRGSGASIENYEWVRPLLQYLIKCIQAGRRDNGKSCPVKIFNKDFKAHSRNQGIIFILTIFIFGKLLPLLEWLDVIPTTFLFLFYMRGRIIYIGSKVRVVAGPQTKKLASIHLQFAICNAKSNIRHNLGYSSRDSPIQGSSLDFSEKIFSA